MTSSVRSATELMAASRQFKTLQQPPLAAGRLTRMVGLTLEAVGLNVPVGTYCQIIRTKVEIIEAEVVGFSEAITYLMPIRAATGLKPGLSVIPVNSSQKIRIGSQSLGRVMNGLGQPLDDRGPLEGEDFLDLTPQVINPMKRDPVKKPLDVGIRAINALLTVGEGQRLGLFAGSGVGKSVLLGMMTRFTEAEIVVVGLIGERGREVKEFIEHTLGEEGLKRAVVVAAPADEAPLMRLRASYLATRIAEYYRDKGKKVLLLMDSLTRFAQAQREISLAIGEPPATKGYPPSVFARLPEIVERAGNGEKGQGSITAFYTVLTEGDDLQDPIADSARAILDGHIVLSRQLAEEGVYPAINIEASISRVMPNVVPPEQLKQMQMFKQLLATYRQNKDLISVGAYSPGADANIDRAIERHPQLLQFIGQGLTIKASFAESTAHLTNVLASPTINKNSVKEA